MTAAAPWSSDSFHLWSDDTPFVAFIRVTNNDAVETVTVNIMEEGSGAITPFTVGPGLSGEAYVIIE